MFIPNKPKEMKPKRFMLMILVPLELRDRVKRAAKKSGISVTSLVKQMVEHCLADMKA